MTSSDDPHIQRKLIEILRVIDENRGVGARIISDALKERAILLENAACDTTCASLTSGG